MNIRDLILGIFFLLTIAGNIDAASFDCGKATSEVEKIICGNDELSRLDESLNKAYLQALKRNDIKKRTIERQRLWLKNERNACKDAECMKKAYETRIKELILSDRDGPDCGETPDLDSRQKGVTEYSNQKVIYHSIDGEMKGADSLTVWNGDARKMCFSLREFQMNIERVTLKARQPH